MPSGWLDTIADVAHFWRWGDDRVWAMTWRDTLFWLEQANRITNETKSGK